MEKELSQEGYDLGLAITIGLTTIDPTRPPYKWEYDEDPFSLTIMWGNGAKVKYLPDLNKTPDEIARDIYEGDCETEWVERLKGPSNREVTREVRAAKSKVTKIRPRYTRKKGKRKKKKR